MNGLRETDSGHVDACLGSSQLVLVARPGSADALRTRGREQACIAASRLFVPHGRLADVKQLVRGIVDEIKVGDPTDGAVTIGPLASQKQYNRVQ